MHIKHSQIQQLSFLMLAVLVVWVGFALRVYELERFPPGIHPDEAQQFLRHWRYSSGYGHPMFYEGAPEPFDSMARGVWGYFAGMSHMTMRYFSTLLNVLGCAATIGASKLLFRGHRHRLTIAIFAGLILTTIPSTVIIGRGIYRANELIFWTPLALWSLARLWQTRKLRDALMAGAFTAMGTMLYLAGPFLAITITLTLLLSGLLHRWYWIGWRNLVAYGGTFAVMMVPWLYLFLTIPGWLTSRLQDFSPREMGSDYMFDAGAFIDQFLREIGTFIQPTRYFAPTYNVQTSGFLNPVLVVFLLIGLVGLFFRLFWNRDGRKLAIILVLLGMMMPPALTATPEETIRTVGVFAPLALLPAFGIGIVLTFLHQWKIRLLNRLATIGLIGLFIGCIGYTAVVIHQHYERFEDTEKDGMFFAVLREQVTQLFASSTPLYIPLEYLNFRTAASYFRPDVTVRPYMGEDLPAGDVIALFDSWYGTPLVNQPQSYGLYLPETDEIVILPPIQPDKRRQIEAAILEQGEAVTGQLGDWLYTRLPVEKNDGLLTSNMLPYTVERDTPLMIIEDNLELLDVMVPDEIRAGEWNSVTLYWRLRESTATDYYANLQLWRNTGAIESYGRSFEQHNHIYSDLAPTVTWRAGEIYTEEKFVFVFDDVPQGGYQWVLNVYTQPNDFSNPHPAPQKFHAPAMPIQDLVAIARSWIGQPEYSEAVNPIPVDVIFEDTLWLEQMTIDPPIEDIQAGDTLTIRLYWEVIKPPIHNAIVYLHVQDGSDNIIAQLDREPLSDFRMDTWQTGQQIMSTHQIQLPGDGEPTRLSLGMYRFDDSGAIIPLAMSRDGEIVEQFRVVIEQ